MASHTRDSHYYLGQMLGRNSTISPRNWALGHHRVKKATLWQGSLSFFNAKINKMAFDVEVASLNILYYGY